MKFKAIKSALVLASVVFAGSAHAAVTGVGDSVTDTGGSELLLSVVTTTNEVYILDTGIGYGDITTTSEFSFANDATLSGLLGSVAYWWVGAAEGTQGGIGTDALTYGRGTQLTSTSGSPAVSTANMLGQQVLGMSEWIVEVNGFFDHNAVENGASLTNQQGDLLLGEAGYKESDPLVGSLGDTLSYYSYMEIGTVTGGIFGNTFNVNGISSELLGSWTLDQDALTFVGSEVAAVVPVPAAVWLFGSALLGMVGVSRRK